MGNEKELSLVDLVDIEVLQCIQDAFSDMVGMAALTTDHRGIPVTKGSNFTDFCTKYTRASEVGRKRCEACDKYSVKRTEEEAAAIIYHCHAGLIDFAAPITLEGERIGAIIGGQVLTQEPDLEQARRLAIAIGVDPDEYVEALKKISIISQKDLDKAAVFLSRISKVFSDIAYSSSKRLEANREIERAAKMKSDFLANMSHEIRTPMNAVIGMAEMALREELPPNARDYINQIKSSGAELLRIINDILDFSKIESGKMDISPVEYETMSVVSDVANVISTRMKEKNVELIMDVAPDIPEQLYGDNVRIKQVLINIANNAVKFTNEGRVAMRISPERRGKDEVNLHFTVEDTGIGIKKHDMEKLFQSFQQLDSKRNRNIEGTGLGLAISKRLLNLMGGDIEVESEYGKGSTFRFTVPQHIVNDTPAIILSDPEGKAAAGMLANADADAQMIADCRMLGIGYENIDSEDALLEYALRNEGKELFFFISREYFSTAWEDFARSHSEITVVLIIDFAQTIQYNIPNLLVVKKPVYTLTLASILGHKEMRYKVQDSTGSDMDFIAPDAKILIVDDNAVNLKVVEGLLEPLKMRVDTALSGREAINRIDIERYDIIYMDHMMPELDGVETTHIIRRFYESYNDVPIVALSANAMDGTKEMFLREGMNDFVPKPIELRALIASVRKWLPDEKIQHNYEIQDMEEQKAEHITVGDLDTDAAIGMLGSEKMFWTVLETYYKSIAKKANLIEELEAKEDWPAYTIEVHALKSSSKQIGAMELSNMAADMEKAGNEANGVLIHSKTGRMLERYRSYLKSLQGFLVKEEDGAEKEEITNERLQEFFVQMLDAAENLDMDGMEHVIGEMEGYRYDDWQAAFFERLKEAVQDVDTDACETIVGEWGSKLE